MKRTNVFSKMLLGAAMVTLSLGTVSCKDDKNDPAEVAEEQNEEKFDDNDNKEEDSEFLVEAAEINMMEIELGKLAQQKAMNADVKEYGRMMESEHMKASDETKKLAESMNVSLPMATGEDTKEAMEDLNDEKGIDFDKKYISMMIDGHKEAIDEMEEASENASSEEIRMWAANMLPSLRQHLDKAKSIEEMLEKMD